jgi:Peptidase family M13
MEGWPVLDPNWDADRFDLFNALAKIRTYGDEPFFSITVDQDMEKPSENVIFIAEPETFATKDELLSDAGEMFTESYERYMFDVTSLLLKETTLGKDVGEVSGELLEIMDLGRYISLVRAVFKLEQYWHLSHCLPVLINMIDLQSN